MEITGWDNVIFVCVNPRGIVLSAVESLRQRWGMLKLDVESPEPSQHRECELLSVDQLAEESGNILVLRDNAMDEFMEDHGYALMADGDGPVSFWYRKRGPVSFELGSVNEVVREQCKYGIGGPEPYYAWLCSSVLFEITVVTPESPSQDPFSSWIVNQVKERAFKSTEE